VVGLLILVGLVVCSYEVAALTLGLAPRGHTIAGLLMALLEALLLWQLATEPAGLGRSGWTSVGLSAGRGGQGLVVGLLLVLPGAALMHLRDSRSAAGTIGAQPSGPAGALGLLGAVGSLVTTWFCFIE
jgi:hypothetical protein